MRKTLEIAVAPADAENSLEIRRAAASACSVKLDRISGYHLIRRSLDARSRHAKYILKLDVFIDEPIAPEQPIERRYEGVANASTTIIVGAGPAGLFAALRLIELGLRPIVLDRGKDVRARRRDLAAINRDGKVDPDSNYCFGEGGAGTYSDGKLYTRSDKRGNVRRVLETLVYHGAADNILVDAHPHIGTNKLPGIITTIRETIQNAGGEVRFESKVIDLVIDSDAIVGVVLGSGEVLRSKHVVLATGHSARDIFTLLHRKQIGIEAKPFALGVRAEHPQSLIDQIQYRCDDRGPHLPPASYALVTQVQDKGVYSFCMCPGGIIAPCATSQNEIVTNGWSPSKRNNPYANSGIVVSVDPDDLKPFESDGPLAGVRFQEQVEHAAWRAGGETQVAPAQRLIDFVEGKVSQSLPKCSYQPGVASVNLVDVLPLSIASRLQDAFKEFGKKMRGYYTNDAILVAPESRTSSPVRIPRDPATLQHPQISGLYPCGEGAGYAGGIVSAAMDGERIAEAIALRP